MISMVLLVSLLLVLAIAGSMKFEIWDSGIHMINADWLDDSEKFKFVARWGL